MSSDKQDIDASTVQHLARLARLTLTVDEETRLLGDMRRILSYVEQLERLDTAAVPPTSHAVELPTALRDDVVQPGLSLESALRNAPERIGDGFGVPKIIE